MWALQISGAPLVRDLVRLEAGLLELACRNCIAVQSDILRRACAIGYDRLAEPERACPSENPEQQ